MCCLSGERIMDYMNMDERSIGMFWVVSYTMAQPACETVMHWLTSAGVTEIPGTNLQPNERLMVMQEVSPLPVSLLSGFSINLCLKLAYQMEESLFSGQVKWCQHYLHESICKWMNININFLGIVRISFGKSSLVCSTLLTSCLLLCACYLHYNSMIFLGFISLNLAIFYTGTGCT